MTSPFLSIIVPARNEELRLPQTLSRVFAFLEKQNYAAEVIVVENGSTDRTLNLAQEFATHQPNLIVVKESHPGKGNAVRRGVLEAHGEYRFICDADLSMPIEEVQKFLPPATVGSDVVIASREAPGAVRYNEPAYRHWGGRAVNLAIRTLILPGLNDTQCGFKCFRAEAAKKLFSQQTLGGWSFDIEILYLARKKRMSIREIPIQWYYDANSKVSAVPDALRMLGDIFRIHLHALRGGYDLTP